MVLPSLHPLKGWSLRKSRGGSPVRHTIAALRSGQQGIQRRVIVRETSLTAPDVDERSIQDVYRDLANDETRTDLILDDVIQAVEDGRSPLVLTERRDHVDILAARLRRVVRHLVVLHGGLKPRARREALSQLAAIEDGEERLVIATGRYIGEGFDDARLDTLFLAMPISWKGTVTQYVGRLHRLHPDKVEVIVFDYVDSQIPVLARMHRRRLKTFRSLGYGIESRPMAADSVSSLVYEPEPE